MSRTTSKLTWLVSLLICPKCRRSLELLSDEPGQGILLHASAECIERYPVIDEIPRMLIGPERLALATHHASWFTRTRERRALLEHWRAESARTKDRLVAGFDFEWGHFSDVGSPDLAQVFKLYFEQVGPEAFRDTAVVLDAGSGAGRWAYEVARRGPRVVGVDLGLSVEVARDNTESTGRVALVQADLRELPLAPGAFDWAYSLGVLHHIKEPAGAMADIVEAIRPGGMLLLYLYYSLDNRGRLFRALFAIVDLLRRICSRSPRPVALAFSSVTAALVYWPLARTSAVLTRFGALRLADKVPLSYYRARTFRTMMNDSLDRFGTRVEHRYSRAQMTRLMQDAGLVDARVSNSAPYWHGVATRPEAERE